MKLQAEILDDDVWEDVEEASVAWAPEPVVDALVVVDRPADVNIATHAEGYVGEQLSTAIAKSKKGIK